MNRRSRILVLAAVLLALSAVLAGLALTADRSASGGTADLTSDDDPYPGRTLVTVQSYDGFANNNGEAFVLSEDGERVWEYDPPNSRVFDAEYLPENDTMLVSVATHHDPADCPEAQLQVDSAECVENRVVELDYDTMDVVWEYSWYDEFIHHHEIHDADRLENGNTAIVDMGEHRAFTVDEDGEVAWEWYAEDHMTPGTEFYEEYGGPERQGPESDWTHMNDVDRLENGNFQLSIRNYDVVIEVDPETDEIVDVVGEPRERSSNDPSLNEQHNPHRLEDDGTILVADSGNDRVVEFDVESEEVVWEYGGNGLLHWPRDADRLPNGHTLVVDSLHYRVIELNARGEIVWEYSLQDGDRVGIPYDADRISVPEEPSDSQSGSQLKGRSSDSSAVVGAVRQLEAYAFLMLPGWVRLPALAALVAGTLASLWLLVEVGLLYRRSE